MAARGGKVLTCEGGLFTGWVEQEKVEVPGEGIRGEKGR